jgi:acylphosphatase
LPGIATTRPSTSTSRAVRSHMAADESVSSTLTKRAATDSVLAHSERWEGPHGCQTAFGRRSFGVRDRARLRRFRVRRRAGHRSEPGRNLVEVSLPSKAAAIRLQLEAETYGIEFNDHYLRNNGDGSVTVSVFGTEEQVEELADAGYEIGVTIEGPNTWRRQVEARQTAIRKETRAAVAATGKPTQSEVPDKEAESSSCARTTSRTTPAASCPSRPRRARRRSTPRRAPIPARRSRSPGTRATAPPSHPRRGR